MSWRSTARSWPTLVAAQLITVVIVVLSFLMLVVPFFISDGLHSFEDIPVMLGAPPDAVQERLRRGEPTWINPTVIQDRRIWYTRSIGDEPHIPDVVVERVRESALLAAVETPGEVPGMRLVA
jgi:hypothetical protein